MKVKNINTKILLELKELKPKAYYNCKNKFSKVRTRHALSLLDKWISGEDYPTYNQLVELSKRFNVPFGYFFLEKLPKYDLPIPHYRTIKENDFIPSEELLDTIKFAQKIQEWSKDILLEWGNTNIEFCGKYKNNYDLNAIVEELSKIFDISEGWANSQNSWKDALSYFVSKAEEKGIIVLLNGIVGNNNHRKLNVEEFRGFVLYDEIAPVVFINNNDALSAKIFTLIHEVVHLLIGQSASFDLRNFQAADNEIEKFCDKCTAEFLVPEKELSNLFQEIQDYEKLAKFFKVSQIVIARRLLDLNLIDQNSFFKFLQNVEKTEYKKNLSKGGNFYDTEKNRLSSRFLRILKSAIESNTISFRDALLVTNLNIKTLSLIHI
jgi:Zn-dependent peptidase ImmA (M78 family)